MHITSKAKTISNINIHYHDFIPEMKHAYATIHSIFLSSYVQVVHKIFRHL